MSSVNFFDVDKLKTKIEDVRRNFFNLKRVHLCIYNINKSSKIPFLEYLLYKYGTNVETKFKNKLLFPFFNHNIDSGSNILETANKRIKTILHDNKSDFEYKGYIYDSTEMYIFYEIFYVDTSLVIGDLKLSLNNFTNDTSYLFTTIDEIVNARKILNYEILEHVISFFYKFPEFIYLKNNNNEAYEIPTVQYSGSNIENINYRIFMGIAKSSSMALFGPYYYFSELETALKYGGWDNYIKDNKTLYSNSHGKYKKGAVLRYAIFKKRTS